MPVPSVQFGAPGGARLLRMMPRFLVAFVLLAPAVLFAQDSPEAAAQAASITLAAEPKPVFKPPRAARAEIEEIIVTATRRPAERRSLPASIVTLSGAELEGLGAAGLGDFLQHIAGIGHSPLQDDFFRIAIRGIQTDASAITPQATGVFIDDLPFNDPFLSHQRPDLAPFDLAGVELLKGPQGTLFGGSGLAGALRYRLQDAVPGRRELKLMARYQTITDGAPDRVGGAAVNLPLGAAGLRVVGLRRLKGGLIDDLRSGEKDTDESGQSSGRALLRWQAGERWSVGLKALRQETRADDLPVAETTDGRQERERALRKSPSFTSFDLFGLDVSYSLPGAEFDSATHVLRKLGDLSIATGARILGIEDAGQPVALPTRADVDGLVQEFRLRSPDAASRSWQWLVGAFAHDYASFTTQQALTEDQLSGQQAELLALEADITASELALFGEVSRHLGRRVGLTLGLRAYRIETGGTVVSSGPLALAAGSTESRNDARIRASGLNPKFAVQFQASETLSSYLSIARGFRFGGIQLVGPSPANPDVPQTYDPDSLWNYEWGLRSEWFERALQIDGALFYIEWKDPQVQGTTEGVPFNVIQNVDGARSYGAELELRALLPVDGLRLTLSAAYTHARTTEEFDAAGGITVPAGSRLPGQAEQQFMASLRYAWNRGGFAGEAVFTHVRQGRGVNDIYQSLEVFDYQASDLRLSLARPGWVGQPCLSLGLLNLADARPVIAAYADPGNPENITTSYLRPRSLNLQLDMRF